MSIWCKKNIFCRKIIPVAGISPEKTTGGGVAGGVERERRGVCVCFYEREREMRKIKKLLVFILFYVILKSLDKNEIWSKQQGPKMYLIIFLQKDKKMQVAQVLWAYSPKNNIWYHVPWRYMVGTPLGTSVTCSCIPPKLKRATSASGAFEEKKIVKY